MDRRRLRRGGHGSFLVGRDMSLKTPLGRVLGLGSAKEGTDHWWGQRVSAVAMLMLGSWFIYSLLQLESLTYLDVIRFIGVPLNGVLLSLLSITLSYHSYLGVQVVIEDYVHAPGTKVVSLLLSRFAHVFVAIAAVYGILVIGIGS
jgi:succinate dehydrogenase / fumarate reductase membrane anchor subunit